MEGSLQLHFGILNFLILNFEISYNYILKFIVKYILHFGILKLILNFEIHYNYILKFIVKYVLKRLVQVSFSPSFTMYGLFPNLHASLIYRYATCY